MLTQTYPLLIEVQLLDVVDHLLLEAALVRLCLKLCKSVQNLLSDSLCTFLLICFNLLRVFKYLVHIACHVVVKYLTLLCAECVDIGKSLVDACLYNRPVFVSDHILLLSIHDFRHSDDCCKKVIRIVDGHVARSNLFCKSAELLVIFHGKCHVNLLCAVSGVRLESDEKVNVAACQRSCNLLSYSHFLVLWEHGCLEADVCCLAVE